MRLFSALALTILSCFISFPQSKELPDILKPDAASEAEAKRIGAEVFKLLPLGMYKQPNNSTRDQDNPIGVREGGAVYSFTARSHSYNKGPEIALDQGYFRSGFTGSNYGFLADLGSRDLSIIDCTTAEARYFLNYRPPLFAKDIGAEVQSLHQKRVGELTIDRSLPVVMGDSYLFRSIRFGETDTLLVLQILRIEKDGSLTIAWKKLADFAKPFYLFMPDDELQQKVRDLMANENITDIEVVVKDNELTLRGKYANNNLARLKSALKVNGIKYLGMNIEMRMAQDPKPR